MSRQPARFALLVKHQAIPLAEVMAWMLPMVALVAFIIYPRSAAWGAEANFSIWQLVIPQMAGWFLFGMGIYLVSDHLRAYVAMGASRKRFAAAAGIALAGSAAILGLVALVGHQLEAWFYAREGWVHAVQGTGFLATSGQPWLLAVEVFLVALLFGLSGLLVGWSYQFTSPLPATLLLVLTALVPLGVGTGLLNDPRLLAPLGIADAVAGWGLSGRALASLAFSVVLFLIVRALLGGLAIRPRVP